MTGLKIEWHDPRGKVWHLTEGTEGVVLDLGQAGLGWSALNHVFTHNDLQHAAATVGRGIHTLKVLVGHGLAGAEYYRLANEWWAEANSPFKPGTLVVRRPDGVVRTRRLRLFESPDTEHVYDPGIGQENGPELWALTGNGSWWYGPEQVTTFTRDDVTGGSSTPFYGDDGAGWPLHIAGAYHAGDAWLSNEGQGPLWLKWTLTGPLTSVRFGVEGVGVLSYSGTVAAGEVVEVNTDPTNRYVTEIVSGDNRYNEVTGIFAPVPVGGRVPLTIVAEGLSTSSAVTATGRASFARAF